MSTDKAPGEELPEDLKAIETALRQLTPRAAEVDRVDRDRLMYLAGQASAVHASSPSGTAALVKREMKVRRNLWPLATAALTLVSITLGGVLLRSTRPNEHMVYLEQPGGNAGGGAPIMVQFPSAEHFPVGLSSANYSADYFRLRNLLLTRGVDALPESPVINRGFAPRPTPPSSPALWHALLGDES
jgi:hypothetical protein